MNTMKGFNPFRKKPPCCLGAIKEDLMVHPNLKDQYYDNIIDDTSLGKYCRINFINSAVIL